MSGFDVSFEIYNGTSGNDYFNYHGSKTLFADGKEGNDFIWGNTGNDLISGGTGNDELRGWSGRDVISGDAGDDKLFGEADDDDLYGGYGNDQLDGGSGNDLLNGYGGTFNEQDTLTGGTGADTFVLGGYQPNSYNGKAYYLDSTFRGYVLSNDHAIITDFSAAQADKIQVFGDISDYRLEFGSRDVGSSNLDTAIYKGNDLIAILQDTTNVALSRDFVSARPSVIG